MNQIKGLFQRKKELLKWWMEVTQNPNFDEVLLHARSMILESSPSSEMLSGARVYENALVSLPMAEEQEDESYPPLLQHKMHVPLHQQLKKP